MLLLLKQIIEKDITNMNIVHAEHNKYHNTLDINYYNGYILRIDCDKAEGGLITAPNSQRMLDALAIDDPPEYLIFSIPLYTNGLYISV